MNITSIQSLLSTALLVLQMSIGTPNQSQALDMASKAISTAQQWLIASTQTPTSTTVQSSSTQATAITITSSSATSSQSVDSLSQRMDRLENEERARVAEEQARKAREYALNMNDNNYGTPAYKDPSTYGTPAWTNPPVPTSTPVSTNPNDYPDPQFTKDGTPQDKYEAYLVYGQSYGGGLNVNIQMVRTNETYNCFTDLSSVDLTSSTLSMRILTRDSSGKLGFKWDPMKPLGDGYPTSQGFNVELFQLGTYNISTRCTGALSGKFIEKSSAVNVIKIR